MSDDSDYQFSGDEFDDKKHAQIVDNVLKLHKPHNLKKPSRTEPTLQISEFNLVKSVTGKKGSIQIDDLTKVLKAQKKHVKVSQKVESVKKKTHTLPKPLEKPQKDRIKRSVGYEKTRFLFDRWEAFVTSNRAQAHQVFPIGSVEKFKDKAKEALTFPKTWTYKTPLEKALDEVQPKIEEYHMEEDADKNEFPLTLEELKEQRKEAAKLRAHQSYKEAKARRNKKIKSKKYHRILRKERIKQKLKEFEELQKTDPEAALKKLDEIEKSRALERFSLRHKSTGQWAKSKQVRAKYDKESRQVLAEQLQISRELTQKQKVDSDSEDEGFVTEDILDSNVVTSSENPWTGNIKADKEVSEFVSSYKKFWVEHNDRAKNRLENKLEPTVSTENSNLHNNEIRDEVKEQLISDDIKNVNNPEKTKKLNTIKTKNPKKLRIMASSNKKVTKKAKKIETDEKSSEWDIEELFTTAENKLMKKAKIKLGKTKTKRKEKKEGRISKKGTVKTDSNKKSDLTIPSQKRKAIVDEPMSEEVTDSHETSEPSNSLNALKSILRDIPTNSDNSKTKVISPDNFQKPKITKLDSAQPDLILEDENSEETSQAEVIMEALEDDDIAADFAKEKESEREQDKPQDIDLNLPGWGSWAGTGIDPKKQRKRKRFIVKMPEVLPRRDDNKGSLIINEKAAVKIKTHLVSEVPFPFKTVKDYEASIRAPIGRTFVPELAYRRYIKPAVSTKIGAIIEPATTSQLMGKPKVK